MEGLLHLAAPVAALWTLLALTALMLRSRAFGVARVYAPPSGRAAAGVLFAFGPGMSPTAKESVRGHLAIYAAGVLYHLGTFAALAMAALCWAGVPLAGPWPGSLRGLTLAGALAGLALLVRRLRLPHLRHLSVPDDYVSNLLTTALSALACATSFFPQLRPALLAEATLLLLYLPLGKIKHCIFFFSTRYQFGLQFGRRGVLPPRG